MDETGEPAVDSESDGECLASREMPAPPAKPLTPCDKEDRPAVGEATLGLLLDVKARARWLECRELDT